MEILSKQYRAAPDSPDTPLGSDLIWGVAAIADEINRSRRQTFYLLDNARLPAQKIGGRWCSSRSALRAFFASQFSATEAA